MKVWGLLVAASMLFAGAPALAADGPPSPRVVNLPVELKDPYQAYTLGLVPFGASAAATYVGTTRLSWMPNESLAMDARNQTLVDLGLLMGAGLIATVQSQQNITDPVSRALPLLMIAAIPAIHAWFHAPFWGNEAVNFNKAQMERAGFTDEARTN